jgi:hypothetical protein
MATRAQAIHKSLIDSIEEQTVIYDVSKNFPKTPSIKKSAKKDNSVQPDILSKVWTGGIMPTSESLQGLLVDGYWRQKMINTMYYWVEQPHADSLQQFCTEYSIPRSTLYFWRNKYDDFRDALDEVKLRILDKNMRGAKHKQFDREVVFRDAHLYDPEWDKVNKYHADLKLASTPPPTAFTVNMLGATSDIKSSDEKRKEIEEKKALKAHAALMDKY